MRCMMTASRRAKATIAFFIPRCLAIFIAQALWAAAATVHAARSVHSLHAYFILGGRLDEPVRYEVDRVRNGRSFMTRRVVARQSYGAILTLEASFHLDEQG
ncbi:hypothetical protein B4Q13_16295, partial [Lacticaseibacillus rhamnosus]